jgi:hypothetical protein
MAEIGSSYIAWPDLLIGGVALALFYGVTTRPPDSLVGRVLAVLCGCAIAMIIVGILIADRLTSNGVHELATIGIGLAFGLFKWNDDRRESKNRSREPAESQTSQST